MLMTQSNLYLFLISTVGTSANFSFWSSQHDVSIFILFINSLIDDHDWRRYTYQPIIIIFLKAVMRLHLWKKLWFGRGRNEEVGTNLRGFDPEENQISPWGWTKSPMGVNPMVIDGVLPFCDPFQKEVFMALMIPYFHSIKVLVD